MNIPSLRQLQYLLAVVELRHFGKAAERCFVSQSTLSAGIYELENILDATLIERTKRKVLPTLLGLDVASKAEKMLFLAHEMVEVARDSHEPLVGVLRLGVIPTISPFLLPRVLAGVRKKFPELKLMLVEDQSAKVLERINRGELDCAIIALPYDIGKLQSHVFWEEDFVLAFPAGHKMAGKTPISSTRLPVDELLLLEEGHCLRDHALAACHFSDLSQSPLFQGTSLYTLIQMVAGGQGITFLPEMALDTDLIKQAPITMRPLKEKGPHRQICFVWRQSCHRKGDLILLADTMKNLLSAA